jgi:CheY-like chemotaxis protein
VASKTILIVDDEPLVCEVLDELFTEAGYITLTAQHGAQALAILAGTLPDLIMTDLRMPVLDGFGLCRAVVDNPTTRAIPLVLMSAVYDLQVSIDFPIAGFLLKPFDFDMVLTLVAKLLR